MRLSSLSVGLCLWALTINSVARASNSANSAVISVGAPEGFEELQNDRRAVVDVYFGGAKVGETLATIKPGFLILEAPAAVVDFVESAVPAPELLRSLQEPLKVNADLVCNGMHSTNCGSISPDVAAIIYDEQHFRVDLFINPRFLKTKSSAPQGYLPIPSGPASVTSVVSVAAAGDFGRRGGYNFQNRTIAGFRNGRIRTSNSIANGTGWVVDDLVAEVDRRSMRYAAGLLWAPGDEFTGQRRILGGGFGTQFDTSSDRELMDGTPLVLFVSRPAQVELLVDGRLAGSRSYPAGNNEIDTSSLSDGSYLVTLRIHEDGAPEREERRFFVKNAQVAPLGRPVVFGYAGFLANTARRRPVTVGSTLYYHAGVALRVRREMAIDVGAVGTRRKTIGEAGAWLLTRVATMRIAGLVSTKGDLGALVRVAARNAGPVNLNLDVRRVWSADSQPLIPLSNYIQGFDSELPAPTQLATGSFTQVTGSAGLRIGSGSLSLIGTYRKDRASKPDYSVGSSVTWPLATRRGLQVIFQASASRSRTTTAGFATLRVLAASGHLAVASSIGQGFETHSNGPGADASRLIGSVDAQYDFAGKGLGGLVGQVGADRDLRSANVRGGASYSGALGNGRVEIRHQLEGPSRTHYDVSLQSGLAFSRNGALFGAQQTSESAVIVSLEGDDSRNDFRVLVDDIERGHLRSGDRLSLFLPAYRTYRVRLLPMQSAPVELDTQARAVTLYPGNVVSMGWTAERYATLFAQAISQEGRPVAGAFVQTQRSVAQTDDQGYFQINVRPGDILKLSRSGSIICSVVAPSTSGSTDLISAGKVACK